MRRNTTLLLISGLLFAGSLSARTNAEEADRFRQLIQDFLESSMDGDTLLVTQDKLNELIVEALRIQSPKGLEKLVVHFEDEQGLKTTADVDMDQVDFDSSSGGFLLRSLLSGKQTIDIDGILEAEDGTGRFEIRKAALNSFTIPTSVVKSLLRSLVEKGKLTFDPTEPFPLPYGITKVLISAGKARVSR